MDFQFQPSKEGIWAKWETLWKRSEIDFYINLIFSDNKCPIFFWGGGRFSYIRASLNSKFNEMADTLINTLVICFLELIYKLQASDLLKH